MPLAAILGSCVAKTKDESDSRMSTFLDVGGDLNATFATVTLQFPEFQRTTIRLPTTLGIPPNLTPVDASASSRTS